MRILRRRRKQGTNIRVHVTGASPDVDVTLPLSELAELWILARIQAAQIQCSMEYGEWRMDDESRGQWRRLQDVVAGAQARLEAAGVTISGGEEREEDAR